MSCSKEQKELNSGVFVLHFCLFLFFFILKALELKSKPFRKFRVRCFFLSGKEYFCCFLPNAPKLLKSVESLLTFGRTATWSSFVTSSRTIVVVVVEGIDGAEE
jgi:hypothetical protein